MRTVSGPLQTGYYSGTLLGPGQVKHPGSGLTHLGELSGGLTPRVEAVAAVFRAAGIETAVTDRILD